jgi:hypothetical protein
LKVYELETGGCWVTEVDFMGLEKRAAAKIYKRWFGM